MASAIGQLIVIGRSTRMTLQSTTFKSAACQRSGNPNPVRISEAEILRQLQDHDFHVRDITALESSVRIRLGCGASVTIYPTGTLLVQGRFEQSCAHESVRLLKDILGPRAKWCAHGVPAELQ